MKPERLLPGLSIDGVRDGGCYILPDGLSHEQTNLFFKVSRFGNVFIKIPTDRGLGDNRSFIKHGQITDADVRPLEDTERFEDLPGALERIPGLAPVAEVDPESAHYLAVHWMQYDRLRAAGIVGVPEARVLMVDPYVGRPFRGAELARPKPRPTDATSPAIIQERIPGATLWEMFDFTANRILPAWQPFKATIASQLSALLDSRLVDHVDWNIKNFVFNGAEQRLYYVDSKPTIYVARSSNDHNLSGIRAHFLA
jgi:hypothetical protein